MINFFRHIRKQLANENKFQKYFRYAFGEVVLIMLGIFMALQLQNWNEKRKQNAEFKATLEQLYNSISFDFNKIDNDLKWSVSHYKSLDSIMKFKDSIPPYRLPYVIYRLSFNALIFFESETGYHAKNLNYNSNDENQNELSKNIINYVSQINKNTSDIIEDNFSPLALEYNIPPPNFINPFSTSSWDQDSLYYKQEDIQNAKIIFSSKRFEALLKKRKFQLAIANTDLFNKKVNAQSLLTLIKNYYPEVKLLYQDIGIIGTAINGFDDVGAKSTPMILTDVENGIWEITLTFKTGAVKFRCRDSWSQNWGGYDFPKGIGIQNGPDISVSEAGNYHIIFKPVTGEYEFIKQDD